MKVAIYGGSFDPVHSGHLEIIDYLSKNFDKVIIVPTTVRYYKKNVCMFSFNERYNSLVEKTKAYNNVEISDLEREASNDWRYFHTLYEIKKDHAKDELFTVMGSDSFNEFETWSNWSQIMSLSKIVVIDRPGFPIDEKMTALNFIEVDTIHNNSSSTALRNKLTQIMEDEDFEEFLMDVGWYDQKSIAN